MGRAIEIISGTVTNPSTTLTAWTMNTGDSNMVRNFNLASAAHLEDAWGENTTAGALEIKSPKLHDNVQGILLNIPAATPQPRLPDQMRQLLYPQDTLTILQSGEASGVDAGALLIAYDDLPGANARLYTWAQIQPMIKQYLTVQNNLTSSGTAGLYSTAQPINQVTDLLKANTDYALLGYAVSVTGTSIGWRSPDFSNYRIGGPCSTQIIETRDYFLRKAVTSGDAWIPVFNSANKGSTFVDCTKVATSTAVVVYTYLAQVS